MARAVDMGLWRTALAIAVPIMVADGLDSVLWIVDTYFVSRLGDKAVAAVGLGGYLSWLAFTGTSIFYVGTLVVASQALGAGMRDKAGRAVREAVLLAGIVGIPIMLAFYLGAERFVSLVAGPEVSEETKLLAASYLVLRLPGVYASYLAAPIGAAYRAAGNTRPVLYGGIAYTGLNMLLDPILIYGLLGLPRLEVRGAALASSIASIAYLAVLSALLPGATGLKPGVAKPTRLAAVMTRLGAPAFAERVIMVVGHLAYLGLVARCGDPALAAHTIGVRIESLAFLPLYSLGEVTAALVGRSVGEGSLGEARRRAIQLSLLGLLLGSIAGLLLAGLSGVLPQLFTRDPVIELLSQVYLVLAAGSEPLFGLSIALTMSIRGAGNTTVPLILNTIIYYTTRIGLGPLLVAWLSLPRPYCAFGAWTTMLLDHGLVAILGMLLATRLFNKLARRVV